MRAAATGSRSVTRLEAVQELTAVAEKEAHASIGGADPRAHDQPFPAWAVAILAMNALSHSADTEHGASTRDTSGRERAA
jgi:hypothetical protein